MNYSAFSNAVLLTIADANFPILSVEAFWPFKNKIEITERMRASARREGQGKGRAQGERDHPPQREAWQGTDRDIRVGTQEYEMARRDIPSRLFRPKIFFRTRPSIVPCSERKSKRVLRFQTIPIILGPPKSTSPSRKYVRFQPSGYPRGLHQTVVSHCRSFFSFLFFRFSSRNSKNVEEQIILLNSQIPNGWKKPSSNTGKFLKRELEEREGREKRRKEKITKTLTLKM